MFSGKEEHEIAIEQARQYIERWRKAIPSGQLELGGFFGRAVIDKILAQPGCVGLRFYYARLEDGPQTIVLVGADEKGNDLWQGTIAEKAWPCPPFCPPPPD